jgi:hypothetical protein
MRGTMAKAIAALAAVLVPASRGGASADERPTLHLPHVADFELTGDGGAPAWNAASWIELVPIDGGGESYRTRAKLLWSERGIYVLVDNEDRKLSNTALGDNDDLFKEDVVEAFFWPDETQRLYFEYELSPLGAELPLLVPNDGQDFLGWLPWRYFGDRRPRRAVKVRGGEQQPGAAVSGWSAEFSIPFALLRALQNCPPQPGTRWRGNVYRIDYDGGRQALYAWSPRVGHSFHNFQEFGTFVFDGDATKTQR